MSAVSESQRAIAYSVVHALEAAEESLVPEGCHSRLWAATRTARATLRYLRDPSFIAYHDLVARLDQLREIESMAVLVRQLPPGCLVSRGISLSIHISQAALAGAPTGQHALKEAVAIRRMIA